MAFSGGALPLVSVDGVDDLASLCKGNAIRRRRQELGTGTNHRLISFSGMPKYYFHIRSGDIFSPDDQGVDFPDVEAAKKEAFTAAREMIADMVLDGDPIDGMRFEVTDESGNVVLTLPFRFVLD